MSLANMPYETENKNKPYSKSAKSVFFLYILVPSIINWLIKSPETAMVNRCQNSFTFAYGDGVSMKGDIFTESAAGSPHAEWHMKIGVQEYSRWGGEVIMG